MQLSPARGRLLHLSGIAYMEEDTAHPREGTPPCPLVLSGVFRLFLDILDELCYS